MPRAALLAAVIVHIWATDAAALCALKPKVSHVAVRAIDGRTVALDDGSELRIAGILSPEAPLGTGSGASWPPADAARGALERLVLGKRLDIAFEGRKADRYGRKVAHAFVGEVENRRLVAEALVEAGQAIVAPTSEIRACLTELLAAEGKARATRIGLWAEAAYAIRDAEKPADLLAANLQFTLVEGRVLRVSASKSSVFIEFGRRWREDFTALVRGRDRQVFAKAGIDLALLAGRRIRLRGWIEQRNGPFMRLHAPAQIEMLDRPASPPE